jgi:hypothetical protein
MASGHRVARVRHADIAVLLATLCELEMRRRVAVAARALHCL